VVTARRGASKLGCLLTILVVAAVAYFGVDIGEAYWRYYQFKDAMKQELRFRSDMADDRIRAHMQAAADSLGLPPEAGAVIITRDRRTKTIFMHSQYDVTVTIPGYQRDLHFEPRASDTY
jgi:hypothetical protein